ncbi:uncharacterized protein F4807DRAFT_469917 [Annulohypoxylon truncatum]|uniref:uncharacterized protein n=1 Tax=Annulohypoxylon truncatum TaxID=327061 RepID=UPI002007847F|nr:uncharacterized protein F4807DRAFT_469917 [Annulohypoxylon truncatum]KAI1206668.1 hypothetical protein F4807DRAFT_469917 [Annulohypoxylon truncatum]
MRFSILSIVAAYVAGAMSLVIPQNTTYNETSHDGTQNLTSSLSPASHRGDYHVSYDCGGSIMCPTVKVVWCDLGINRKLIRNDDLNYGAIGSGKPHFGVCHGKATDFGCGIIIQGPSHCVRSGNDMWWDYQEIRQWGCHHCGHKYWGDGCSTDIDYWQSCRLVW